jgi:hypothetical protein
MILFYSILQSPTFTISSWPILKESLTHTKKTKKNTHKKKKKQPKKNKKKKKTTHPLQFISTYHCNSYLVIFLLDIIILAYFVFKTTTNNKQIDVFVLQKI